MFRKFLADENGYALVLTLLFLPVFVGVGLLVVDIGRGNNAQSDLQAAADALALAGARELDGLPGSRAAAQAAMARLTNSVNFLDATNEGLFERLRYSSADTDGRPFLVEFLRAVPGGVDPADPDGSGPQKAGQVVPGNDNDRIDQAFVTKYRATDDRFARYVLVQARSQDLDPFFFIPLTQATANVPVAATAVATLRAGICDTTPFYMCNPFSTPGKLFSEYDNGNLYGRLLRLGVNSGNTQNATPGNIGFLDSIGSTPEAVATALAGLPRQCSELVRDITTRTGAVDSAWVGYNTRFDIYANTLGGTFSRTSRFYPAENVRKGYAPQGNGPSGGGGPACRAGSPLPKNANQNTLTEHFAKAPFMSVNETNTSFFTTGPWNLLTEITVDGLKYPPYWQSTYGTDDALSWDTLRELSDHPDKTKISDASQILTLERSSGIPFVSRYDIYRYEIEKRATLTIAPTVTETGLPSCFNNATAERFPGIDRRTMYVAVVDCNANVIRGRTENVPVVAYAKMFLVSPVDDSGSTATIDMEIINVLELDSPPEQPLYPEPVLVR